MSLTPYWYQKECIDATVDYLYNSAGNGICHIPTSGGKSLIQAEIARRILAIAPAMQILCITDITALIGQNRNELLEQWPEADTSLYSASYGQKDASSRIVFAGIQSVHNKAHLFKQVSAILIDECSTGTYDKNGMYWDFIQELKKTSPHLRVIGMDATPWAMKGPLTDAWLFDDVIYTIPMSLLLKEGFLTPLITPEIQHHADTSKIKVSASGEYNQNAMREVMSDTYLIDAALDDAMKYAHDRRSWMVFACSVSHAKDVMARLKDRGISCEMVTGETKNRDEIYDRFRNYEFTALVSVNALTTGFNAKNVDLGIVLRSTKSSRLWIQMMGRLMRKHPNKVNAMVLDYGENIDRFGCLEDIEPPPTAAEKAAAKKMPFKLCGSCEKPVPTLAKTCPYCGSAFESMEVAPTHGSQASTSAIMRSEIKPVWLDIMDLKIRKHTSSRSGNTMMKIAYNCGLHVVNEYIAPELNRRVFVDWWAKCSIDDMKHNPPTSLDIAMSELRAFPEQLLAHTQILVDMSECKKTSGGGMFGYKIIDRR